MTGTDIRRLHATVFLDENRDKELYLTLATWDNQHNSDAWYEISLTTDDVFYQYRFENERSSLWRYAEGSDPVDISDSSIVGHYVEQLELVIPIDLLTDPTTIDVQGTTRYGEQEDPSWGLGEIDTTDLGTVSTTPHIFITDPLNPDTDGDGVSDGVEVQLGSDPTNADSGITKSVTPEGQVNYGDELTYTLVISAVPGIQIGLYDPLVGTTFTRFVGQHPGVSHTGGVVTGTLTVTPSNQITVSFVVQVGVPGTAAWVVDVTNRACVYPVGGTLGVCTWSNEVINSAFRPYHIYLPITLRHH